MIVTVASVTFRDILFDLVQEVFTAFLFIEEFEIAGIARLCKAKSGGFPLVELNERVFGGPSFDFLGSLILECIFMFDFKEFFILVGKRGSVLSALSRKPAFRESSKFARRKTLSLRMNSMKGASGGQRSLLRDGGLLMALRTVFSSRSLFSLKNQRIS